MSSFVRRVCIVTSSLTTFSTVCDSDVPWIQTQNKPNENAIIIHIDADPLKAAMPLFYIPASHRYNVSSYEALLQLDQAITSDRLQPVKQQIESRLHSAKERASKRKETLAAASSVPKNLQGAAPAAVGLGCLTKCLPEDRFIVCEAISKSVCINLALFLI